MRAFICMYVYVCVIVYAVMFALNVLCSCFLNLVYPSYFKNALYSGIYT